MTKVSRNPLSEDDLHNLTAEFWRALALLRTARDIETLLGGFLTHTEVKMFAKRLRASKMLSEGKSYEDVRRELKMTDTPIARLNNLLNENKQFKNTLKKLYSLSSLK